MRGCCYRTCRGAAPAALSRCPGGSAGTPQTHRVLGVSGCSLWLIVVRLAKEFRRADSGDRRELYTRLVHREQAEQLV